MWMAAADEDHYFIPANGKEMNSDDDESSERDEMDDDSSGEDGDDNDNDDDDDDDDDSSLVSDDEEINYEVVETFIRTFDNGDLDDELEAALSFDRGVTTFPVRPTQASYHKPDNWRERNRIGLEKVKEQLQECINLVMYNESGRVYLRLIKGQQQPLMDNEEPIVWHEHILDHYWNQLENEIDRRKQLGVVTEITGIDIRNVEMKKERLATLVTTLSGQVNTTESIIFYNTNLCHEGILSLSKLVDVSSKLIWLFLHHNQIDSFESARCLSRSLRSHARINQLDLAGCDIGSSPEILLVILQSDVNYINLENNNIDSLGAVTIAEYLEGDPPIRRIDLECNHLNNDDALLISQALKRNTNLNTLSLHTNNFTSNGVKALLTCVFDNTSLNSISESNHTLTEMKIFSVWAAINLNDCIGRLLQSNRTQKIILALQDKDSLLQYFANVPMELIPDVLAFHHGRGVDEHQHKQLNIVYSTMRWWNMPLLYSHHKLCSATISDTKRKRDN